MSILLSVAIVHLLMLPPPASTSEAAVEAAGPLPDSYSRRVWQSPDGLPEDYAQAIAQTPDGLLWIGTSGGLVRFDGVRFTIFNPSNEPAFKSDSVYSLLTTRDGTLWAGTEGAGLVRYHGGSFRLFARPEGLTNLFIRVIFEDRSGALWIGTDDGLFRMDGQAFTRIDNQRGVPHMSVHAICQDRAGRILVGGAGLLILDGARVDHYRSTETLADNSFVTLLRAGGRMRAPLGRHAAKLAVAAMSAFALSVAIGAQTDPIVGTWTLDVAKSTYKPGPPPKSATVVIDAAGKGIKVSADAVMADGPIKWSYTSMRDGKDVPVTGHPTYETVAVTQTTPHEGTVVYKKAGKTVVTVKTSVSKDGKTLTTTTDGVDAKGQKMHNVAQYTKK